MPIYLSFEMGDIGKLVGQRVGEQSNPISITFHLMFYGQFFLSFFSLLMERDVGSRVDDTAVLYRAVKRLALMIHT